jgi:carotenoid 1,2-hydratase
VSDDGAHGLTIIAMLGSVFSPFYARARASASADPLRHVSMHVVAYGPGTEAWSLTERDGTRGQLERSAYALRIGASTMRWRGDVLEVEFDERTAPWRGALRGRVRLHAPNRFAEPQAIDGRGAHLWWPIAPSARAEVEIDSHGVSFRGAAYPDANAGDEPLERRLRRWDWARLATDDGALITYDVEDASGQRHELTLAFDQENRPCEAPTLVHSKLARTRWGVERATRADHAGSAHVLRSYEDTPFYARSLLRAEVGGKRGRGVHESLDLERFRRPEVQFLLPFRMIDAR